MGLPRPRNVALGAAVAALTALAVGDIRQRRRRARHTSDLYHTATTDRNRPVSTAELAGLPDPVRHYFDHVLPDDQPSIGSVRLEQTGRLRAGGPDSAWKPFTATQHVTTDPPGFFWNASVRLWPLVSLRIADLYRGGNGHADISLLGLPLGGDEASPELNHGELLRYLAEAVWYPTALLPSEGVEWDPIDERTAAATLTHGDTTATLTFHFTADNEVSTVHAEARPRRVADGYEPTPWTGRWYDYQTRNGVRVPTAGEVIWHLPEGDMSAWRGRLTDISYN